VLAPGDTWRAGERDALVAAFMQAGAGVLEIGRLSPGSAADGLAAALEVAHRDMGAGLVLLAGHDHDAPQAMALLPAAAARSTEGRAYAAVARLGPGDPVIRFAPAPDEQGWPMRAPLFCALLEDALPAEAGALGAACRAALH
jgi:hypothetical protein